jgi:hypothetical protein
VRCPISSYQDVNWGYNTDAPTTDAPLSLGALNDYLATFGYFMQPKKDPYSPECLIHWVKKGSPIPITMAAPQFQHPDFYDQLVYDIFDVQDMLEHLDGDEIDGKELQAKRRDPS